MPLHVDDLIALVSSSQLVTVEKPWGREQMIDTGEFIVKVITVNDGHKTSLQYHERKLEVLIPLEGAGVIEVNNRAMVVGHGPIPIMPGTVHRSIGPITMLEFTSCDNEDVVRLEDDYGRSGQ